MSSCIYTLIGSGTASASDVKQSSCSVTARKLVYYRSLINMAYSSVSATVLFDLRFY